jgi:hypothetical protein
MLKKSIVITLAAVAGSAFALDAAILSTDFTGSTGGVILPYADAIDPTNNTNTNASVTRNQFNWTQTDATVIALRSLDTLTIGAYSWGSAGTPISAGRMFTTLDGGAWNTGTGGAAGIISNLRATGTTDPTRARFQFNSTSVGATGTAAPANVAVWNLLFEVGTGGIAGLDFSFRAGTAATSGAWDNNTAANNGNYNIRITPVTVTGGNGSAELANSVSVSGAVGAGAGPTVISSYSSSLASGVYLVQLEFSSQATQRNALGDFQMTAIPEPSTYAALLGLMVLGVVALRRRR